MMKRNKFNFIILVAFFLLTSSAQAEPVKIVINEFLPNPIGSDAEGEWIELKNLSDIEIPLFGWKICDKSNKCFEFKDEKIERGGYLSLRRSKLKISINNSDEELILFAPGDKMASRIKFIGTAKEGYSFSRFSESIWRWTSITTLGKENYFALRQAQGDQPLMDDSVDSKNSLQAKADTNNYIASNKDTSNKSLSSRANESKGIFGLAIGLGLALSGFGVWLMRRVLKN